MKNSVAMAMGTMATIAVVNNGSLGYLGDLA